MLVALTVLAIVIAVITPRLVGQERREFELAVEQVVDLMTMFAQRDALAGKPAGIWHDAQRNWIVLLIMDVDELNPTEGAEWLPDPFVRPVRLPGTVPAEGVLARVDGDPIDFASWPIATAPGRQRQSVEIELRSDQDAHRTIVLPSHAVAPYELESPRLAGLRRPIDLDAAGRTREDW